MINEVIISRLDEIIGDYNTPFFNYLLYSYDLSLNECEVIINDLKDDISSNKILSDNIVLTLENYFRKKIIKNRKDKKILYLTDLIDEGGEFYSKYLKKYDLSKENIKLIYEKVKERILDDDLDWFEIERYVEYYFSNSLKQVSYINDLNSIVGRNYDTLIIRNAKAKYPILNENDIVQIVFNIHGDIIDANDFPSPIKDEFLKRCMHKSEAKKADAFERLNELVEGKGDSFNMLCESKNLTYRESELIVDEIKTDISKGLVEPSRIDGVFLTKRFNEYIENEKQ